MGFNTTHRSSKTRRRRSFIVLLMLVPGVSWARGPSPYLPLDLAPAIERQIERVLMLAGKPVVRRPIAAAIVLDALPTACERDRALCEEVRRYLDRYMKKSGVTHARVEGAIASGDSTATLPNRHGEPVDSAWRVGVSGYYQPNDYVILNVGGVAYDGQTTPTGSFLSVGFDFAQLDIGYRDHWLGPMRDSSMLISTEAPTMPSITLSNYQPITRLGLSYEIFAAEMSRQSNIAFQGGTTEGKPRLAGLQIAMEPVIGYALAFNRITQYGGGARGGSSLSDFFDALTTSSNEADELGGSSDVNRIASLTSSILFPGTVPFAVHLEYAGEDNAYAGRYRLGQTNLTLGLDFPVLWRNFDASLEMSEFQNGWYIHHIYPDGPRNDGHSLGHWFGDNRLRQDALGGNSYSLRGGWRLPNGNYVQAGYRSLHLDTDWALANAARPYKTMQTFEINYGMQWRGYAVDAQLELGEDIFGDSFARVTASVDLAGRPTTSGADAYGDLRSPNVELFVDVGIAHSSAERIFESNTRNVNTGWNTNGHVGFGARRRVSRRSDVGVRFEADRIDGHQLFSVRAVDYRFRLNKRVALGSFFGVGRYDFGLPAYGYYWGVGLQCMDLLPNWSVSLDLRHHEKLGRDKVLPNDPPSTPDRTRLFFDIDGVAVYVSRRL